jgi:hypothetical protein
MGVEVKYRLTPWKRFLEKLIITHKKSELIQCMSTKSKTTPLTLSVFFYYFVCCTAVSFKLFTSTVE